MIYLDSDGVLADWRGYVEQQHLYSRGLTLPALHMLPKEKRATLLREVYLSDPELFYHLKPTPAASALLCAVDKLGGDWAILTAGAPLHTDHDTVVESKQRWYKDRFGIEKDRVIVVKEAGDKTKYAKPGHILVDDHQVNCEAWVEAGGVAIHTPSGPTTADGIIRCLGYASNAQQRFYTAC